MRMHVCGVCFEDGMGAERMDETRDGFFAVRTKEKDWQRPRKEFWATYVTVGKVLF
jgi:hypothetical protein